MQSNPSGEQVPCGIAACSPELSEVQDKIRSRGLDQGPALTTTIDTTETTAATTATCDAPNIAVERLGGADTGQADSRHAADHVTGANSTGPGEDAGRARWLAWLDPRALAVHPRNVRDDLRRPVRAGRRDRRPGVLEALNVVPHTGQDGGAGFLLVAGHRRAAAAILAGLDAVPCVVRPDERAVDWVPVSVSGNADVVERA